MAWQPVSDSAASPRVARDRPLDSFGVAAMTDNAFVATATDPRSSLLESRGLDWDRVEPREETIVGVQKGIQ